MASGHNLSHKLARPAGHLSSYDAMMPSNSMMPALVDTFWTTAKNMNGFAFLRHLPLPTCQLLQDLQDICPAMMPSNFMMPALVDTFWTTAKNTN